MTRRIPFALTSLFIVACAERASEGPRAAEPPVVAERPEEAEQPAKAAMTHAANPVPETPAELAPDAPGTQSKVVAPDGTEIVPCEEPPPNMACIEGGPFIRGSDDGPDNTRPAETIWLQTFYMDVHETTYAEYKACQQAKRCPRAGPLYNDFSRLKQPMVGVDWFEAVKFCEEQGKHLPSEAQWEKGARGPDGALHPWGDEPATCERAVIKDEKGRSCGVKKRKEHPDKGRTFEVGSKPPGVYGLHDMSGNAWEWVYDWASPSYEACGDACGGTDPKGPCDGADKCPGHPQKVVRGGSWYWDARYATGIYRRFHVPNNEPFHHFGFRCAASLDEARKIRAVEVEG